MTLERKVVAGLTSFILAGLAALVFLQPKEPFPISSISAREAITIFKKSEYDIVLITAEKDKLWYLTLRDRGNGQQRFIEKMESQGWNFDAQEGSGLFFSNQSGNRIGGCRIWNRKYLLCHD